MSHPINDDKSGGPAFPCFNAHTGEIAEGMSVRMLIAKDVVQRFDLSGQFSHSDVKSMVTLAFLIADSMIAESKK